MMRQVVLAALVLFAPAASYAEEITGFKKAVVLGKEDGSLGPINTADISLPVEATLKGVFLEFTVDGKQYMIKASDAFTTAKVQRVCLPGRTEICRSEHAARWNPDGIRGVSLRQQLMH
jgi:hypothetical protein